MTDDVKAALDAYTHGTVSGWEMVEVWEKLARAFADLAGRDCLAGVRRFRNDQDGIYESDDGIWVLRADGGGNPGRLYHRAGSNPAPRS